jgi:type VI protein secretion system component Hcp
MKRIKLLLLLVLVIASTTVFSQVKIFITAVDVNGVNVSGESTFAAYAQQIEALSFGQENNICNSTAGPCPGKAGRFSFALDLSVAVTPLRRSLFKSEKLQVMNVIFARPIASPSGFQELYRIRLENVQVTTATDGLRNGASTLTTSFDVDAERIGWTYLRYNSSGSLSSTTKFGWNTITNSEWIGF